MKRVAIHQSTSSLMIPLRLLKTHRRRASTLQCIGLVTKVTLRLCGCFCKPICCHYKSICTVTHRFIKLQVLKRDLKYLSALCHAAAMWVSKTPVVTPHWILPLLRKQDLWSKELWQLKYALERNVVALNFRFRMCATIARIAKTFSAANAVCSYGYTKIRVPWQRNVLCAELSLAKKKSKSLRKNSNKQWSPTNSTHSTGPWPQSKAPRWTSTSNF